MAFPNVSDIVATTIEQRSRKIADNIMDNNAALKWLGKRGNVRTFSGGTKIYEEIAFAENANAGYYSGYDLLPMATSDVITAAEFAIKQAACPVVWSGLEELMNSGREQMIDLLEQRIKVGETTLTNMLCEGIYSDGTGSGGKQITGLAAAVPITATSGTYGNINRATWTVWQTKSTTASPAWTSATLLPAMNTMWASLTRGADRPDLILADGEMWALYMASLQALQRFAGTETGKLGFPTIKYMDADVVLDGGIGGNATAKTMYFLNTKYLHWRPHARRNMVPLSPNKRWSNNQDAESTILAWAGNMTCSGSKFQGRLINIA